MYWGFDDGIMSDVWVDYEGISDFTIRVYRTWEHFLLRYRDTSYDRYHTKKMNTNKKKWFFKFVDNFYTKKKYRQLFLKIEILPTKHIRTKRKRSKKIVKT